MRFRGQNWGRCYTWKLVQSPRCYYSLHVSKMCMLMGQQPGPQLLLLELLQVSQVLGPWHMQLHCEGIFFFSQSPKYWGWRWWETDVGPPLSKAPVYPCSPVLHICLIVCLFVCCFYPNSWSCWPAVTLGPHQIQRKLSSTKFFTNPHCYIRVHLNNRCLILYHSKLFYSSNLNYTPSPVILYYTYRLKQRRIRRQSGKTSLWFIMMCLLIISQ